METTERESICQCLQCGHVFSHSQKRHSDIYPYGVCPLCGGRYTTIRFANPSDERYAKYLNTKFSR